MMRKQDWKRIIHLSIGNGVTLDEESVKTENGTRSFMTFSGEKEFIIVQEPAVQTR